MLRLCLLIGAAAILYAKLNPRKEGGYFHLLLRVFKDKKNPQITASFRHFWLQPDGKAHTERLTACCKGREKMKMK